MVYPAGLARLGHIAVVGDKRLNTSNSRAQVNTEALIFGQMIMLW